VSSEFVFLIAMQSLLTRNVTSLPFSDNDLGLDLSLVNDLAGMDVISASNDVVGQNQLFQALLGTPARHPLIQRALLYSRDTITGIMDIGDQLLGPFLLAKAMFEYYNISSFHNPVHNLLLCKGVFLLKEEYIWGEQPAGVMPRMLEHWCNVALLDVDGTVYGYSRVKQGYVEPPASCYLNQYARLRARLHRGIENVLRLVQGTCLKEGKQCKSSSDCCKICNKLKKKKGKKKMKGKCT
jgi:hypothetical protein